MLARDRKRQKVRDKKQFGGMFYKMKKGSLSDEDNTKIKKRKQDEVCIFYFVFIICFIVIYFVVYIIFSLSLSLFLF